MASTYLSRTPASAGNRKTFTISVWVKRTKIGVETAICSAWDANNISSHFVLRFSSTDVINIGRWSIDDVTTTRLFRDTNAWYHIVLAVDTTQATAADRMKLYVNGVQETSFSVTTYPNQNDDLKFNSNVAHNIGRNLFSSPTGLFEGCMSHFHFIDGTAYAPTVFGETDATTGEWKIKTDVTATYGTNGFFILKDGNSVTDQSGNSNNFTVAAGTLTNTEDNPSNVFATMNPLGYAISNNWTLVNGNTSKTSTPTSNAWRTGYGTIGASSGKYYWEFKVDQRESSDLNNFWIGIVDAEQMKHGSNNERFYQQGRGYGYHAKDGVKGNNNSTSTYGDTWTTNDILGCAVDLDNNKIYFSKNGVWQNSGDPTSGATGTGSAFTLASGYTYLPAFSQYYGNEQFSINMGNGYFGTTAISSEGTNASGNGKFEYDVPTGYTALSTKGLNL